MPRVLNEITVLVASPSDVSEDRDVVRQVADQLNNDVLRVQGIQLSVISWESHAAPSFGSDPQDVINRQLSDWDIFIGLLGTTFGTPTPRADSGTEEEFNRAYERWKDDSSSCRLMVYFSEVAVAPSAIDAEQLAKVQKFRDSLGRLGGLYWTYRSREDLRGSLHDHLMSHVHEFLDQKWGSSTGTIVTPAIASPVPQESTDGLEDDVLSLLDVAAETEAALESLVNVLERMSGSIQQMGSQLQRRTHEMNEARDTGQLTARRAKVIVSAVARDIQIMAGDIDSEVPELRNAWEIVNQSLFQVLAMSEVKTDEDAEALRTLETNVETMKMGASAPLSSVRQFRSSIEELGKLSREMGRPTRMASSSIARLTEEIEYIIAQADEIKHAIRIRLEELNEPQISS